MGDETLIDSQSENIFLRKWVIFSFLYWIVCRVKTSFNLRLKLDSHNIVLNARIYRCKQTLSLWFYFHSINLKEEDQSPGNTFVKTSWLSWVRSLVSRKCATQLITINQEKVPCSGLQRGSPGGHGHAIGSCSGHHTSVDATQDHGHWERWPSDAVESHVWMFWEAVHYRCTPNVTHTLIWKKWWKSLTLIEKFYLFIWILFSLSISTMYRVWSFNISTN